METDAEFQAAAKLLPRATIDSVGVDGAGDFRLTGWLVSGVPVVAVQLVANGVSWGSGTYGLPRPDVAAHLPHYPRSASAGFAFFRSAVHVVPANLELEVVFENGSHARIQVGTSAATGEAGVLPASPTVLLTVDESKLDLEGRLLVTGWAHADDGIARIEVFGPQGLVGIGTPDKARPDVLAARPGIVKSEITGFLLELQLPGDRTVEVQDVVRLDVRAISRTGDSVEKSVRPVIVERLERKAEEAIARVTPAAHEGIKLHIDKPESHQGVALQVIRDRISVEGWAVARGGVASVEVSFDSTLVGKAHLGIRRPDVERAFRDWPDSLRAGFSLTVPLHALTDGDHFLRIAAVDKNGDRVVSEVKVQVDASIAEAARWALRTRVPHAETLALLSRAGNERPRFAVLIHLGSKGDIALLRSTLSNLRRQTYDRWRIVLTHDLSKRDVATLRQVVAMVPKETSDRIEICSVGSLRKYAPALGTSEWLVTLQPGDRLSADALVQFAVSAVKTGSDFLYADERRFEEQAAAVRPFFKPGWSPQTLLSFNFIGSTIAVPASTVSQSFGTLAEFVASSPYDRALRMTELAVHPVRVPRLLAEHLPSSAESRSSEQAALASAMERRGERAKVEPGRVPGTFRVRRKVQHTGRVSIIIPTIATGGLVKRCIESIRKLSTYRNFEIVLLDNIRGSSEWKAWFARAADRVLFIDEPFNWSRFNNIGREHATGDYLLFLNDDTEVIDADWLQTMLELAQCDDVGVVGPKLLYPDGSVQHAGMFLGRGSSARHAFRFFDKDDPGYFGAANITRNVIAVTGACMLVRAEVFDALGGFDEAHDVINNDVDFCLRCNEANLQTVFTPYASLIHHEDVSRASLGDSFDDREFARRWGDLFAAGDPFFNPNLSLDSDGMELEGEPVEEIYAGYPILDRSRIRHILAMKLDHIGDFVTAVPAMRRLTEIFPNAKVSALVGPAVASLANSLGLFEKVHTFSFFHAKSGLGMVDLQESALEELHNRLAPEGIDLAIDLRKATDTRDVLKHTGALWTAGFDRDQLFPWLDISLQWEGDPRLSHKHMHVAGDLLNLVACIENAVRVDRQVLTVDRRADALPDAVRRIAASLYARPVVCIHPASGNELRQWPVGHFSRLIDLLVIHLDVHVAVIGGPGEEDLAKAVLQSVTVQSGVWSLVGAFKLHELPAVLKSCALFVGNNSGPKHVAAGLGVPTVAVHSAVVSTEEWGPLGPDAVALRRRMDCSPCYLASPDLCARGAACLTSIDPWRVFEACRDALASKAHLALPRP